MKTFALAVAVALSPAAFAAGAPAKPAPAAPKAAQKAPEGKPEAKPAAPEAKPRVVAVEVTKKGFEPATIEAKPGETLVLEVTRTVERTCATGIVIPDQKIDVELPLNETVPVTVKVEKAGNIRFGCPMGQMISGAIVVKP